MRKNLDAYYRGLENMLNNSDLNHQILSSEGQAVIKKVNPNNWFDIS